MMSIFDFQLAQYLIYPINLEFIDNLMNLEGLSNMYY